MFCKVRVLSLGLSAYRVVVVVWSEWSLTLDEHVYNASCVVPTHPAPCRAYFIRVWFDTARGKNRVLRRVVVVAALPLPPARRRHY